jgi:two-component system sensor histidine kinase KdpD
MFRSVTRQVGIRSVLAVPIPGVRAAHGVLNVYFERPRSFTPGETGFVVALAEHAGTALERAERRAQEHDAAAGLRDLDAMKSQFVATVSHELRTPLTAVVGFALTLRSRWATMTPEVREDCLDRLGDNARSLEHLITHLLDFGRLERGEFALDLRPMDVGALVRSRVRNMEHDLRSRQVRVDVPDGLVAMTDPYAFERILGNLLSNAAKFSPETTEIAVSGNREGDDVLLRVRDRGPGIPTEELDRVFDVFYRGTTEARGTGIGLAVVRDLVDLHGGRVSVRNANPGTEFTVALPAAVPVDSNGTDTGR